MSTKPGKSHKTGIPLPLIGKAWACSRPPKTSAENRGSAFRFLLPHCSSSYLGGERSSSLYQGVSVLPPPFCPGIALKGRSPRALRYKAAVSKLVEMQGFVKYSLACEVSQYDHNPEWTKDTCSGPSSDLVSKLKSPLFK